MKATGADTRFQSCRFDNNFAESTADSSSTVQGGAIYVSPTASGVIFDSCIFWNNSAGSHSTNSASLVSGGAVFVDNAAAQFINCSFAYNTAFGAHLIYGGAVTIASAATSVVFLECHFTKNSILPPPDQYPLGKGGAVALLSSSTAVTQFTNCTFQHNHIRSMESTQQLGGALFSTGSVVLQNCFLSHNEAYIGAAVAIVHAVLTISQSVIADNTAWQAAVYLDTCSFHITESQFVQNWAEYGAALSFVSSTGEVSECMFRLQRAAADSGCISIPALSIPQGVVTISRSVFSENSGVNGACINAAGAYLTRIDQCLFVNNGALLIDETISGGALFIESRTVVTGSVFVANTAVNGAAVYIAEPQTVDAWRFMTVSISDCGFWRNNALNGGAVFTQMFASIENSTFEFNTANVSGGAIVLSQVTSTLYNLTIHSNAATSGGAIFLENGQQAPSPVECLHCSMYNNTALSGPCYASAPMSIQAQVVSIQLNNIINLELVLLDLYEQVVVDHPVYVTASSACIQGLSYAFFNAEGYANISLVMLGANQSFAEVQVSAFAIAPLYLQITLRGCSEGFGFVPEDMLSCGGQCVPCPVGQFNLNGNGTCLPCPNDAICAGGAVAPEAGYWGLFDASSSSVVVSECMPGTCALVRTSQLPADEVILKQRTNADAAVTGAVFQWTEVDNECSANASFVGFMCAQCPTGFSQWGTVCAGMHLLKVIFGLSTLLFLTSQLLLIV
eukprot:TRINITY_DN4620_c0_g1_i2.p1 TRINITY_DN4620_c0_g1~~TRINITY_DN4620_c0_g1_i2.p1  ORF type:complete len:864 (-),score=169.57 TRINITY_DN4620_c0_g1_i2:1215-3419(-)